MTNRFHSFVVAGAAAIVGCCLITGCAKDESVADSTATPVNMKAGVPSNLPSNAPPVVAEQIKASQDAGKAMQTQAEKNAALYQASRDKAR